MGRLRVDDRLVDAVLNIKRALARTVVTVPAGSRDEEQSNVAERQTMRLRRHAQKLAGQMRKETLVRKKSATKTAIDVVTTAEVVEVPTPSVPPRVIRPK